MKKLIYILTAATLITACSKKLDLQPQGVLTEENVFKQAGDFTLAVDAAYEPLTNRFRGNWEWDNGASIPREFVVGDLMSDDAVKGGGGLGDQEDMRRMETFTIFPTNNNVLGIWRYNFKGVNAANTVLAQDGSAVPGLDANIWKRMKGEMLFLRAFYYFRLVQNFGGVPLLIPEKDMTDNTTRATTEQVYDQIREDLDNAAPMLEPSYDAANYQRATKGAAYALKAKTYLYQGQWQSCLDEIAKVEALPYNLLPQFADNFNGAGEQGAEKIFVARHDAGQTPQKGSIFNAVFGKQGYGWNFNLPTDNLVAEFEPGDPRLSATVFKAGDTWFDGTPYNATNSITGYNVRKFMSNTSPSDDGGIDFIYIRLADVLLWKAECFAQLNKLPEARTALERVRGRARSNAANPATALPEVTTNVQADLLAAIRHERRVELAFEWHRYYDLVRWNIAATVLAAKPDADPLTGHNDYGTGYKPANAVLPIPQREVDLIGLKQNDGYQ